MLDNLSQLNSTIGLKEQQLYINVLDPFIKIYENNK